MDPERRPILSRVVAVLVLLVAAAIAIRLVVGLVAGLVTTVLWIVLLVAVVVAVLWARSTLKAAKRERGVRRASKREVAAAPAEDPVMAEMRRLNEQLREQGRL
jgi:uncharacterized membrane protein